MNIDFNFIEGNKLLAEFLGYKYYPHNHPDLKNSRDAGWKLNIKASSMLKQNPLLGLPREAYLCRHHKGLKYHSDWNHLMKVVDKIEKTFTPFGLRRRVTIDTSFVRIDDQEVHIFDDEIKILSVWALCCNFIKKYNDTKNETVV